MMVTSRSMWRKFFTVLFSTTLFTGLAIALVASLELPLERHVPVVFGIGLVISLFEEFYVQGKAGRWLRAMHPLLSITIYSGLIVVFAITVMWLAHGIFVHQQHGYGPHTEHGVHWIMYFVLPQLFGVAIFAIVTLRVIGYLGGRNLFDLMTGKYFRPVMEMRIFLFLDINGSTALVERLGPIDARGLIGKFFFDISGPITDYGGDIYRFTGDGVVAVWDFSYGISHDRIIQAVDALERAIGKESKVYQTRFGAIPKYRIGIHGGPIVASEEGDTKKAIGYYGDTIHIAARLEEKAKKLGVQCLISGAIAESLKFVGARARKVGSESMRGTSEPIDIYELQAPVRSR